MNDSFQNKDFDFHDLKYFFQRNYFKIISVSLISLVIGCFLLLRTKPTYISNAKILIEKKDEDNFAIGAIEGFSDKSVIEDKIEILRSRTIAETAIRKLATPNSFSVTSDGKILYNIDQDIDRYSMKIIDSNNLVIEISGEKLVKGCGILKDLNANNLKLTDIILIDPNNEKIDFRYVDNKNISNGCELPKYDQLIILNTAKYNPRGFRKTFEDFLDLGGILGPSQDTLIKNIDSKDIKRFTQDLQESTQIENIKGTNILSITIESLDYFEAKKLVDTFIASYIDKEKEWANLEVSSKIDFLKNQIKKKTKKLDSIEQSIQAYQEKYNIYNEDGDSKLLLTHFLNLENEYNKERISYKDLKFQKEIFDKETKKNDIPKSYELSIKDSIRNLNVLIELSETRIENINNQLSEYQNNLDELPAKTRDFVRLKRDRMILDNSLISLEEKLQSAQVIFESESGPSKIIVSPQVEKEKIKPKVFGNLILSLFIGFFGSCLILFFIEFFSTAINTVEDLEKYGLSVLSIIPSISGGKKKKSNQKEVVRNIITAEDPKSPISESYRTLRTSIMYSSSKDKNNIMISSPGPGEGKTTTVCNLAITYANLGKKTLLVDADLRKPIIHKIFNLNKEDGLTKYLVDKCDLNKIIQKTDINNFDVISCGIVPPNPSELLNSDEMKKFINEANKLYDVVLIDSPPIIAVTDALVLSKIIDNFVLVCRSNVTQKGALERSIKSLQQIGGNFSGTVLNAITQNSTYGSGYYYNYYQYYYGENDNK